VEQLEANRVRTVLAECRGNKSRASIALGITRKGLRNKIRRYGIADSGVSD
jgi:two-component system response regulator HupR/HoxA